MFSITLFKTVNHIVGTNIRLLSKNDNSHINSDNKLLKTIINIPLLLGIAKDKKIILEEGRGNLAQWTE